MLRQATSCMLREDFAAHDDRGGAPRCLGAALRATRKLLDDGVLILAGPTLGRVNTGIAIFEAPDEEAATAPSMQDPRSQAGMPGANCGRFGCRCYDRSRAPWITVSHDLHVERREAGISPGGALWRPAAPSLLGGCALGRGARGSRHSSAVGPMGSSSHSCATFATGGDGSR